MEADILEVATFQISRRRGENAKGKAAWCLALLHFKDGRCPRKHGMLHDQFNF